MLLRYTSHTSHVLFLVGSDPRKVVRYTHPATRVQTLSSKEQIVRPRDRWNDRDDFVEENLPFSGQKLGLFLTAHALEGCQAGTCVYDLRGTQVAYLCATHRVMIPFKLHTR
jgi:hypothetical protein